MKKRIFSSLLALIMALSLLPATAFALDACISCGRDDGTHADNCRFNCPTSGCAVTYNGSKYIHSVSTCPYTDSELYCAECGYLEYRADEEDYFHADGCSIGYPSQDVENEDDKAPDPIANQYVVNGVTYFGVDSDNFDDSTALFIRDMLSSRNDDLLGGKSTAALWQYLAYCIQDDNGRGTSTGKFKSQFDGVIPNGLAYNTGSTGAFSANLKSGDNYYNVKSSGLVYAGSMAAAAEAMENQLFSWYRGAGGGRNDQYGDADDAAIAKNNVLWDDTDSDHVYWMATGAFKTSGRNKKGHYQVLGVLFSDFTITTILPGDDDDFYQSSTSDPEKGSTTYASNVKNMTNVPVSAQQEISDTVSTTATSEINGSTAFGFEECLEIGYEHGLLGGKGHVNVSFTASQTIENGWSEAKSCTDEQTTSYNVSVELPAYTNVMMKQSTSETTTTTKYNCPVALNFTVTIVEYTLDPSSNNASCRSQVLATFGANARKDLNQRGVIEYTLTDPDKIVWETLYSSHKGLQSIVGDMLTATAPMASAGATFTVVNKSVTSEISGLAPVYALSNIKTANDIMEYNLTSGEYLYVDTIELEGLNAQNAAYYGFNQDKGHWILVDKDGNALTDSPIAQLVTNPLSGHTKLVAGQEEGTVYLKYLIDEDCYGTAQNPMSWTKNVNLEETAIIEVNVSEVPFNQGTITVSGTLSGIVDDPAKAIEGTDGLAVTIQDGTEKYVNRPVVWDAQETEAMGVKVEDNKISFTKEGTFHVRATTGNVQSAWYEVTALPARELAEIQIPETAAFDYKDQQTLNLAAIGYKDQYGDAWTGAVPTLTWTCNDENAVIDNGVLTVPSAGVYTVTASAGEITSNTMTITVADSRAAVTSLTPAAKTLSSSGGSVEFTITGQNLADGITIQTDDPAIAAVTTTGTDTVQKATLTFPANTDTANDKVYTVTNSLDNTKTAAVTVTKQAAGGGSGGGGGGGGGGGLATYAITIADTENGSVTASAKTAAQGASVTLTVTPDTGYTLETLTVTDKAGKEVTLTDKSGKYTFTMPASNVTVNASFKTDSVKPVNPFTDVPNGAYYEDAVIWAVSEGITSGTTATTFSPDASCTRAQMVTFLWRAAGSPAPESRVNPFTDVAADAYYYDAVLWAVENGITSGTSAITFAPDATCTRAQTVTFLYRAAGSPAVSGSGSGFSDVSSDAYYADAVAWAVQQNITTGTGNGQFSPNADCTRAQIVTFLFRAMGE